MAWTIHQQVLGQSGDELKNTAGNIVRKKANISRLMVYTCRDGQESESGIKKTMTRETKERRNIKRKKRRKMIAMSVARKKKRGNERELYTMNCHKETLHGRNE